MYSHDRVPYRLKKDLKRTGVTIKRTRSSRGRRQRHVNLYMLYSLINYVHGKETLYRVDIDALQLTMDRRLCSVHHHYHFVQPPTTGRKNQGPSTKTGGLNRKGVKFQSLSRSNMRTQSPLTTIIHTLVDLEEKEQILIDKVLHRNNYKQ